MPIFLSRTADPAFTAIVPLAEGLELKDPPPASAPSDLVDIFGFEEADVSKVTGIPGEVWGSTRRPHAVNEMAMNILRVAVGDWHHIMIQVAKVTLEFIYGEMNRDHMILTGNMDPDLSTEENLAMNQFHVQFDGALDPEVLASLNDRGLLPWKEYVGGVARYFNLDRRRLAKEQVNLRDVPLVS
jgi:hypothetical protein